MLEDDEAIRHAGEVIADGTLQPVPGNQRLHKFAHRLRVLLVMVEQFPEQRGRPLVRLMDDAVIVEVLVKVGAQFQVGFVPVRAVGDERLGLGADCYPRSSGRRRALGRRSGSG